MSKDAPLKVFWSWQSDLDQSTCHYFVRDVLKDVAKQLNKLATTEEPERQSDVGPIAIGPIAVDHDMKNLPGSRPIADSILEKIRDTAVFVADVTPVGGTKAKKRLPNPNVMIELGYALGLLGHDRILLVMNRAYHQKMDTLPFDLRHLQGPVVYDLPANPTPEQRKKASEQLSAQLKVRLRPSLEAAKIGIEEKRRKTEKFVRFEVRALDQDDPNLHAAPDLVPTLEEVSAQHPLLPVPAVDPTVERVRIKGGMQFLLPRLPVPLSEWTIAEVTGYNERVIWYRQAYQQYLADLATYYQQRARTRTILIEVENTGTMPASDVRVRATFPPGVVPYRHGELPSPPSAPRAPALDPDPTPIAYASYPTEHLPHLGNPSYFTRVDSDTRSVYAFFAKVRHHSHSQSDAFHITYATDQDVENQHIEFTVAADESSEQLTGNFVLLPTGA